jgi:hypothetical protein
MLAGIRFIPQSVGCLQAERHRIVIRNSTPMDGGSIELVTLSVHGLFSRPRDPGGESTRNIVGRMDAFDSHSFDSRATTVLFPKPRWSARELSEWAESNRNRGRSRNKMLSGWKA